MQLIKKNVANGSLMPALTLIAACGGAPESAPAPALLPDLPDGDRSCDDGGFLSTRLYGALESAIDWRGDSFDCEGMPRPDGQGARLRFAGAAGDGVHDLAFIIALPDLERGQSARELASNVTLIAEGRGLFFSTPGFDTCWTDIDTSKADAGTSERFAVSGTLYCIAPIPEVNGMSSVSFEELRFSGRLDWSAK